MPDTTRIIFHQKLYNYCCQGWEKKSRQKKKKKSLNNHKTIILITKRKGIKVKQFTKFEHTRSHQMPNFTLPSRVTKIEPYIKSDRSPNKHISSFNCASSRTELKRKRKLFFLSFFDNYDDDWWDSIWWC